MVIRFSQPIDCFCGRTFTTPADLEEHRRARGHFACHVCRKSCKHPQLPKIDFRARKCDQCGKICEDSGILEDHRIATGHYFFAECNPSLNVQNTTEFGPEKSAHPSEFRCCDCDLHFLDIHALNTHLRGRSHRQPLKKKNGESTTDKKRSSAAMVATVPECKLCHKIFSSSGALQDHMNSLKHKPISSLTCPMGKGCRGKFTAPSALLHHLESGGCRSGMDRDDVHHLIQMHDKDRIIHKVSELTPPASGSGSSCGGSSPCIPPVEHSASWSQAMITLPTSIFGRRTTSYSLLSDSLLPLPEGKRAQDSALARQLQCPLCPNRHKKFGTAQDLEQHMNSPVHLDRIYHCPINTDEGSSGQAKKQQMHQKDFTTLSGLAQHLESGACYGGKETFFHYVDMIQRAMNRGGHGGIRLVLSRSAL